MHLHTHKKWKSGKNNISLLTKSTSSILGWFIVYSGVPQMWGTSRWIWRCHPLFLRLLGEISLWLLHSHSSPFRVAFASSHTFGWSYFHCHFFLFFLMSLANGLSVLFIFSKNQLLVLLIFAIVSFISFSFISNLIFMISFLLLTLGFFCSSFSNCFRCKVRLFIWDVSCFLR